MRRLFAIIFEGRSGSSELVARLNSHPDIQAHPEILAPLTSAGIDVDVRWRAIEDVFARLRRGESVDTFLEAYSKPEPDQEVSVRGLKTMLNVEDDAAWYPAMGRPQNFYCIEPERFVALAETFDVRLIYLRRRDLLRHAISWIRAVELADRRQAWNLMKGDHPLEPLAIDLQRLEATLTWLAGAKRRHADAFAAYRGPKLAVDYEDLVERWPETEHRVLTFLGAQVCPLESFHAKVTDDDLSAAVPNLPQVLAVTERLGLQDW